LKGDELVAGFLNFLFGSRHAASGECSTRQPHQESSHSLQQQHIPGEHRPWSVGKIGGNMVDPRLLSLHRHWCRADAIRYVLFEPAQALAEPVDELHQLAHQYSGTLRLEVFYSLMFVVIEGYKALKISNGAIDALLKEQRHVERLQRFRNATFHYQKAPISPKLLEFFDSNDSDKWIKSLYGAFSTFFLQILPIEKDLDAIGWKNTQQSGTAIREK
jgi:hypothetical protein